MPDRKGLPIKLQKSLSAAGAQLHLVHQGFVAFSHPDGHFLIYEQFEYDQVVWVDAEMFHRHQWQLKQLFEQDTPQVVPT